MLTQILCCQKKSHSAKVKLSKVGKMAELESLLCCHFPQTPMSAAGAQGPAGGKDCVGLLSVSVSHLSG